MTIPKKHFVGILQSRRENARGKFDHPPDLPLISGKRRNSQNLATLSAETDFRMVLLGESMFDPARGSGGGAKGAAKLP